jgi:hypothetical protein
VPLEVYLSTSWEPDAEYIDGVVEERPIGEYDHSSCSMRSSFGFPSTRRNGTTVFDRSCVFR